MVTEKNSSLKFRILATDLGTRARAGILKTLHGEVPTPCFMPVGTQGTVKAMGPDDLKAVGSSMILANTYHLLIRPGPEIVKSLGGLHGFMGWNGSILTDSGGYQVFSLASLRKIDHEGVIFRSHLDGSEVSLTPEKAVAVQEMLGPDIMMAFDECTPYPASRRETAESAELTLNWARRCLKAQNPDNSPAMFGIIQGGMFPDLRRRSAEEIGSLEFPGLAIGGLAVGEEPEVRFDMIDAATGVIPSKKPLYLMGLGTPIDLVEGIARGADMFDCVMPTRNARNGQLFTASGRLVIKNARYKDDPRPIEEGCGCYTCRTFSRGYLRHLFAARELLAYRLNSIHNLYYYISLLDEARKALLMGKFKNFYKDFYALREDERFSSEVH